MRVEGSVIRASLGVFVALLAAAAPLLSAEAQTASPLNGVYNGRYVCAQGPTNLRLSVVVSPIGDASALFTFWLPAGTMDRGYTYSLHGQYDPGTGKFSLTPMKWETEHPANLGMVGMEGTVGGDQLSGQITGGRCTVFGLSRDRAASVNINAVVAAQRNGGKPLLGSAPLPVGATAAREAPPPPPPVAKPPPAPVAPAPTPTVAAAAVQAPASAEQSPTVAAPPQPQPQPQGQPQPPTPTAATVAQSPIPTTPPPPAEPAPQATAATALANVDKPPSLINPVLAWRLDTIKDSRTGGSSPHPTADTFLDVLNTIDVTASCNQNGMSVFFKTDSYDLPTGPLVFVWNRDGDDNVNDVGVRIDGKSHNAKGFPGDDRYSNMMGLFFYDPGLAQRASIQQQLEVRRNVDLGSVFGPLENAAIDADVNAAAATSGGPVTDLLNAKSIRVDLSFRDWKETHTPYLELNPQDAVLHKFVAECATRFGIGGPAAQPAVPSRPAPPAGRSPSR